MNDKPKKPTIEDIMAKAAAEQGAANPLQETSPLEQLHRLLSNMTDPVTASDAAQSAKILEFKIKKPRP